MDPYRRISSKLPFLKPGLPLKVVVSYVFDYVIILALIAAFYIIDRIEPYHQRFAIGNYTLQYPYAEKERVPIPLALVLVIVVPAGIIAVYTLIIDGLFSHHKTPSSRRGPYTIRKRLWELNCGILGLLLASGTAFVITQALKNATGKPRPDVIDRCKPEPGSKDSSTDPGEFARLSTIEICTDQSLLKDGFRSWPSGHSSSSFAGLFFLTLYLAGKLHILDSRGFVWKTFLVIIPTLGAALIAISRIQDARHHPFDVITGSLLGIACAWGAYRQYFPPLSEPWRKGRAYPIRSWGGPEEAHYVGDGGYRTGDAFAGAGLGTAYNRSEEASYRGPPPAQAESSAPPLPARDPQDPAFYRQPTGTNSGLEPLRSGAAAPGIGIGRLNSVPLDGTDGRDARNSGRNVFREEIDSRRRQRMEEHEEYEAYRRDRERWDDSSEDEGDEEVAEARRRGQRSYELQERAGAGSGVGGPRAEGARQGGGMGAAL